MTSYVTPNGLGMDVTSLVQQMMSTEQGPINAIKTKLTTINTQISDLGAFQSNLDSLKSAMGALTDVDFLKANKISSSDPSVVAVSSDGSTPNGQYQINVTQVAAPQTTTLSGLNVTDPTALLPSLNRKITILSANGAAPAYTVDLSANANGTSLNGLAAAINKAGIGVNALVSPVLDSSGQATGNFNLVLMGQKTGSKDGGFTVDQDLANALGNISGANVSSATSAAKNALYTLNGVVLQSQSNTVTDGLQGLTLTLNKLGVSSINVQTDTDAITGKVQTFVDAYNKVIDNIDSLKKGSWGTDSMLSSIRSGLLSQLTAPYNASGTSTSLDGSPLTQIGITQVAGNKLAFDKSKFALALQNSPGTMTTMLQNGPGQKLVDYINGLEAAGSGKVGSYDGLLVSRKASLTSQQTNATSRQASMQEQLDRRQAALTAQYSALNSSLATMQASLNNVRSALGM